MNRKPRIEEIQILRGLAFLAVVLQHSIAHYTIVPQMKLGDGVVMTLLLVASKFAVPVFVFITGLVLFYNDQPTFQYGPFLKKRWRDIFVPYLLWSVLFAWMNLALGHGWLNDIGTLLGFALTGKASYHLWYVIMVMQFYLLFPWWRYVIHGCVRRLRGWLGIMGLAVAGLLYVWLMGHVYDIGQFFKEHNIIGIQALFNQYADRNALYYSFYFVLGAAAGLNIQRWTDVITRYKYLYWTVFTMLYGYFCVISIQAFYTASGLKFQFNQVFLLRPVMALFLISSIFVVYHLAMIICRHREHPFTKLLYVIGTYSFGAYLSHAIMLRVGYYVDGWLFTSLPVALRMIAVHVIAVLLSVTVTYHMSRFPYGKWLVGLSTREQIRKSTVLVEK